MVRPLGSSCARWSLRRLLIHNKIREQQDAGRAPRGNNDQEFQHDEVLSGAHISLLLSLK